MITLVPIGRVETNRIDALDDGWGDVISVIRLEPGFTAQALAGIEGFSHAEILFVFHKADPSKIEFRSRHPRNNPAWPRVGIFAQRGKDRPNHLGSSFVRILGLEGSGLRVQGLDAIDGTPVLDIKPVMREFLPRGEVVQPDWVDELMKHYW